MSCSYDDALASCHLGYLWPAVTKIIEANVSTDRRAFDLGCGNGAVSDKLFSLGFDVSGVDTSESGIALANATYPHLKLSVGSAYDDLAERFGTFPLVFSLEVIEHVAYPRQFARTFRALLAPGGVGIISTPYHGYVKNLALSLLDKWDTHQNPLWDGGHIKMWSARTLRFLLEETGFSDIKISRVGRIPLLAKSMLAVVRAV